MMIYRDELSNHYQNYLEGSYDCIDRIVLNAYYPILHSPGGLRYWYNLLKGSDKDLDTNHLMRFSGRFSRRVQAFCKSKDIPLLYFKSGERKHEVAESLIPLDKSFSGIFAIFVARAPSKLWEVKQFNNKSIDIRKKKNLSYVNHYYFHIMDTNWGHITIRICSHPPFNCMIILNGHEWVERQKAVSKLNVKKEENCFVSYSDGNALSKVADALKSKGQLEKVCDRWVYGCLWFAIDTSEQDLTNFKYQYSIYQIEYSRNLLFKRGTYLDDIYRNIIDLTRSNLDIKRIKTMFGRKKRLHNRKSKTSDIESRIEKPDYDLTIFKIHFGKLTVKLYDKGERTLRAEVVVHNTKDLKCKRSLSNFAEIVEKLKNMMNSFMNNLQYSHSALIKDNTLEKLATPHKKGKNRVAGINLFNERNISIMETVLSLSIKPQGFVISDITEIMLKKKISDYSNRKASYDLRKLRVKDLVVKIKGTRKYTLTKEGTQIIFATLSVLQKELPRVFSVCNSKDKQNKKHQELTTSEKLLFKISEDISIYEKSIGLKLVG